jgi:hypothetical protein
MPALLPVTCTDTERREKWAGGAHFPAQPVSIPLGEGPRRKR